MAGQNFLTGLLQGISPPVQKAIEARVTQAQAEQKRQKDFADSINKIFIGEQVKAQFKQPTPGQEISERKLAAIQKAETGGVEALTDIEKELAGVAPKEFKISGKDLELAIEGIKQQEQVSFPESIGAFIQKLTPTEEPLQRSVREREESERSRLRGVRGAQVQQVEKLAGIAPQVQPAPSDRVRVQRKDGSVGTIPRSQIKDAKAAGFKILE